tara:strand:- start:109 stop:552 length:444 start_codon:yes stop_codon:yes gene_type:complete
MKNIKNKNFDTALDSNARASQIITELAFLEDVNPFVNKFMSEGCIQSCEYMSGKNRESIKSFEEAIRKELKNNPESPDENLLDDMQDKILEKEEQIAEWLASRDVIVKQIMITYPDWTPRTKQGVKVSKTKAEKAASVKAAIARVSK